MAKNTQGTQPTTEASDPLRTSPTSITPGVTPTDAGTVGSVNVYDTDADVDRRDNTTLRNTSTSTTPTSTTRTSDSVPERSGSGSSPLGWIIGVIVLIVLLYFLLQWIF
jgi:cobalamin biosynthesis Mg chelatase CobN